VHYTMGGLWVDYNLMSTIPGLHVTGEANFSDHGANRLGASALMQGLADGYFIVPLTIGDYLASNKLEPVREDHPAVRATIDAVKQRTNKLLGIKGKRSSEDFHRELGKIMWEYCGMARSAEGLKTALREIPTLRDEFWRDLHVPGTGEELNQSLERAGRVADFLEFAELMCRDALHREESCGGHFRTEHQTPDGEAQRDDERSRVRAAHAARRALHAFALRLLQRVGNDAHGCASGFRAVAPAGWIAAVSTATSADAAESARAARARNSPHSRRSEAKWGASSPSRAGMTCSAWPHASSASTRSSSAVSLSSASRCDSA